MEKLRVFRICPLHTNSEIFRVEVKLDQKSFSGQIELLKKEGILLPGGWGSAMEAEGFQVFETISNDSSLQAQWCKENSPKILSLAKTGLDVNLEILKEQIRFFKPDVIFLYAHALILLPSQLRKELCSLLNNRPLLAGFWGDELPQEYYDDFRDLDFVFCSSSIYQKRFMEWAGIPAETIGNCFDDGIEFPKPVQKKYDFIFCGRTGYRLAQHVIRYAKLVQIASKSNLQIWGYEWPEISDPSKSRKERALAVLALLPTLLLRIARRFFLLTQKLVGEQRVLRRAGRAFELALQRQKAGPVVISRKEPPPSTDEYWQGEYWYDKTPLKKLFPDRFQPLLTTGSDYYRLLAESKLVLNLHRVEDADIGNVRCYEVTGLGSCLVTDRGQEMKEFFDIENDIVTFETPEECLEKVKFLLANPQEIERIARNGQQKTLSRHMPKHRAEAIAKRLKELLASMPARPPQTARNNSIVHAIYDTEKNPISYDVAFFLQAAEIFRKISGSADLIVSIVWPSDILEIPGIPKVYDLAVDAHAKAFRIFHIAVQMAQLIPNKMVFQIKDRRFLDVPLAFADGRKVIPFPHPDNTHHSIYYRLVNENPALLEGFAASHAAHRYIGDWLRTLSGPSKVLCITLRQYAYDPQRNSDLAAWETFLGQVDPAEFSIVIVPDTDRFADVEPPFSGRYPIFSPACFDVDLRFALYEAAYLNMFVNNGPGSAATLSKKTRYLMFKMLAPDVVHCSEEVLMQLGFEPGKSPKYASRFQKWVWADDDAETLWVEFCAMRKQIGP